MKKSMKWRNYNSHRCGNFYYQNDMKDHWTCECCQPNNFYKFTNPPSRDKKIKWWYTWSFKVMLRCVMEIWWILKSWQCTYNTNLWSTHKWLVHSLKRMWVLMSIVNVRPSSKRMGQDVIKSLWVEYMPQLISMEGLKKKWYMSLLISMGDLRGNKFYLAEMANCIVRFIRHYVINYWKGKRKK